MSETLEVKIGASDAGFTSTLQAVKNEITRLEEKIKTGDMSFKELDQTMRKITQTQALENKLKAMGTEAAGSAPKVDGLGKDLKNMGDKAGDAGEKGSIGLGKIAAASAIAGAAVKVGMMAVEIATAAATKTIASFGAALDMGGRLNDLADRTGIAVDKVLLLERAFQNAGVGADALGPVINKMQKAIVDAGDGTSSAAFAFSELGLSLSSIANLSPEEQLRAIGKAIAGVEDPAKRAALSMDIFGKSGGALNQVFANFDGEIQTAKLQLGSLPDIMKASSSQFDRISDNLVVVGSKFIEFAAGIIDKVKPALDAVTTALSMFDAAKAGQELADFFIGAGNGMNMFQSAVDSFKTGNFTDGFKLAWQAIVQQSKDTANSIYINIVAAMKTVGDFIKDQFNSSGPLVLAITSAFDYVSGYIKKVVSGSLADTFTSLGPAFSNIADGLKQSAQAGALQAELAFQRIPVAAELAADKASQSMGDIPANFKKNMADVPPLFDSVTDKQDKIVDKNDEIGKSLNDAWSKLPTAQNFVAISKAQQDEIDQAIKLEDHYNRLRVAINNFDNAKDSASKERAQKLVKSIRDETSAPGGSVTNTTQAESERAANAERARQEKLKESAAIKREEANLEIAISNAIAAGDFKKAEALKGSKALNSTIQDMIKSGMGQTEAKNLANEMGRAAREADRVKNSLATKIDDKIKTKQENDFIDKKGELQKKAEQQISQGYYAAARKTGEILAERELSAAVRGTGENRDRRNSADILKDYYGTAAPAMLSQKEQDTLIRQARDEGIYKDFSKLTDLSKKGLDRYADLNSNKNPSGEPGKGEPKKGEMSPPSGDPGNQSPDPSKKPQKDTLDSLVQKILDLVQKIEPKLPVAALSA